VLQCLKGPKSRSLSSDEQRQLRDALDALLAQPQPRCVEQELERRLFEADLLTEIKPPLTDLAPYRNRKLIRVKGKPLSELIVEERR
jgi:hypothetical protein